MKTLDEVESFGQTLVCVTCEPMVPSEAEKNWTAMEAYVRILQPNQHFPSQMIRLVLTNYTVLDNQNKVDLLSTTVPPGSFLRIMDPVILNPDGSDTLQIECHNPEDLELLSLKEVKALFPNPDLIPWVSNPLNSFWTDSTDFNSLNTCANEHYVNKMYTDAIRMYRLALQYASSDQETIKACNNMGAALMQLGCFNAAIQEIQKVLELDPANRKAILRQSKMLNAVNANIHSEFRLPATELADIFMAYHNSKSSEQFTCTSSDYVGPCQLTEIEGKGRGLIATRDLPQPATIVIRCKAIAFQTSGGFNFDPDTNTYSPDYDRIVALIANKCAFDKAFMAKVYSLHAGSELGVANPNRVDVPRIRRIVESNAFVKQGNEAKGGGVGVWHMPSFLNHSCSEANCHIKFFGEIAIVITNKAIKAGDELLISYVDPSLPYRLRKSVTGGHGFVCDCQLCKFDTDEEHAMDGAKRNIALECLQNRSSSPMNVETAVTHVSTFKEMYSRFPLQGLVPCAAILEIARGLFKLDKTEDCLSLLEFVIGSTNLGDLRILALVNVLRCCMDLKEEAGVVEAVERLRREMAEYYGSLEPMTYIANSTIAALKRDFDIDFILDQS